MKHIINHFEEFNITLSQSAKDSFDFDSNVYTVQYGSRVLSGLNYIQASKELGECLLHAFYCESQALDTTSYKG